MKKIVNILCLIGITIGVSSCEKKTEEIRTPLETADLIGKWAKITQPIRVDSAITDTTNLDTIKTLEFSGDGRLNITRGLFCTLATDLTKSEAGTFEYYAVNLSEQGGTSNMLKFEKCTSGMPIYIQGNTLRLGYGKEAGSFEEYRKIVEVEIPENPDPEDPTDPGDESEEGSNDNSGGE